MSESMSIMERLEMFAEASQFSASLKLWKSQIKKLTREGFRVEVFGETSRHGEFRCRIFWISPTTTNGYATKLLTISRSNNHHKHHSN